VGDIRHETLRSDPLPEIYHPFAQQEDTAPWLVVRVAGDAAPAVAAIRRLVAGLEPAAPITMVKTMAQRRAEAPHPPASATRRVRTKRASVSQRTDRELCALT